MESINVDNINISLNEDEKNKVMEISDLINLILSNSYEILKNNNKPKKNYNLNYSDLINEDSFSIGVSEEKNIDLKFEINLVNQLETSYLSRQIYLDPLTQIKLLIKNSLNELKRLKIVGIYQIESNKNIWNNLTETSQTVVKIYKSLQKILRKLLPYRDQIYINSMNIDDEKINFDEIDLDNLVRIAKTQEKYTKFNYDLELTMDKKNPYYKHFKTLYKLFHIYLLEIQMILPKQIIFFVWNYLYDYVLNKIKNNDSCDKIYYINRNFLNDIQFSNENFYKSEMNYIKFYNNPIILNKYIIFNFPFSIKIELKKDNKRVKYNVNEFCKQYFGAILINNCEKNNDFKILYDYY